MISDWYVAIKYSLILNTSFHDLVLFDQWCQSHSSLTVWFLRKPFMFLKSESSLLPMRGYVNTKISQDLDRCLTRYDKQSVSLLLPTRCYLITKLSQNSYRCLTGHNKPRVITIIFQISIYLSISSTLRMSKP